MVSDSAYDAEVPSRVRPPKPRLSVLATIYFLVAGLGQVVGLIVGLIMLSNAPAAGAVVLAATLALFIPSVAIAASEAKRLDSSTRVCLRAGYFRGFDIFMSLPY